MENKENKEMKMNGDEVPTIKQTIIKTKEICKKIEEEMFNRVMESNGSKREIDVYVTNWKRMKEIGRKFDDILKVEK